MLKPIVLTLPYPISGAGVYRITDAQSGRFYIGSSVDVAKRWRQHQNRLERGVHSNPRLQAIWRAGSDRLTISMVCPTEATKNALLSAEQVELDRAGVGTNPLCMNVLLIAGSHLGRKRSPETCMRLSVAQTGKKASAETRAKQRAAKLGKPQTEQHRRNSANARLGIKINRAKGVTRQLTLRALTNEQVVELREKRKAGMSWRLLGLHFNLHQSVAKRIAIGETYKEVPL